MNIVYDDNNEQSTQSNNPISTNVTAEKKCTCTCGSCHELNAHTIKEHISQIYNRLNIDNNLLQNHGEVLRRLLQELIPLVKILQRDVTELKGNTSHPFE